MKATVIFISIFYSLIGCTSGSDKSPTSNTYRKIQNEKKVDSLSNPESMGAPPHSINHTDSNGLKQGLWIKTWKGKFVDSSTYVNDTLHGPYITKQGKWFYNMGKFEGLQFIYNGKKESLGMVSKYENGEHLWSGFPSVGRDYVIPPKGFFIKKDSVHIRAPFINGQLWYEGDFCLLSDAINDSVLRTHSYGIHIVYHLNGKIKGHIDFSTEIIKEYDTLGRLKYATHFDNFEVHHQPIIANYKK